MDYRLSAQSVGSSSRHYSGDEAPRECLQFDVTGLLLLTTYMLVLIVIVQLSVSKIFPFKLFLFFYVLIMLFMLEARVADS
jgi:hypothetical protein